MQEWLWYDKKQQYLEREEYELLLWSMELKYNKEYLLIKVRVTVTRQSVTFCEIG